MQDTAQRIFFACRLPRARPELDLEYGVIGGLQRLSNVDLGFRLNISWIDGDGKDASPETRVRWEKPGAAITFFPLDRFEDKFNINLR